MGSLLLWLFDRTTLTPHGYCLLWQPGLIWTEALADSLIAAAYFSIPVALVFFLVKRRDLAFPWVFVLFGSFILLCGSTHVMETITFWLPLYQLEAVLKVMTAVVSVATAVALWPLMPRALALPSTALLTKLNLNLEHEVGERRRSESTLRLFNQELEVRVAERTQKLEALAKSLRLEVEAREKAYSELRASEERFQTVVESSPEGIVIIGPGGLIEMVNSQTEMIFGYSRSELLKQPAERLLPLRFRDTGHDSKSNPLMQTQRRRIGDHDELYGLRQDGEEAPIEIGLNPIQVDGEAMVLCTIADITLRKRLEAELREKSDLLAGTFEAAQIPMMLSAPNTKVLMWNRAAVNVFGYTREEMVGDRFTRLIPEANLQRALVRHNAGQQSELNFETQLLHRSGRLVDVKVWLAPVKTSNGAVGASITTMQDITQTKKIEAQLLQAQKMEAIGNLTGGIAHDFNNLLGIIIGNLGLLRDVRPDDLEVRELSGEASDAAIRGADLTRRLLAFARQQPLKPQEIDLNILVDGIFKLLSRVLGKNIELVVDLAKTPLWATADPVQLESALTNLATNARDALGEGGSLTIETGYWDLDTDYSTSNEGIAPGRYATITVSDNGSGIAQNLLPRIFEPFFTTKEPDKGTGLGLSMVYGFMKQSGGHVAVYSELGVGTTFRLFFPAIRQPKALEPAEPPVEAIRSRGGCVLIVEDNDALRRVAIKQLKSLNYKVLEAANASEALEILRTEKVDVVYSDIVMPGGMNGFELAKLTRERWPDIAIILTSGFPVNASNIEEETSDIILLPKPTPKDELARVLNNVLNARQGLDDDS